MRENPYGNLQGNSTRIHMTSPQRALLNPYGIHEKSNTTPTEPLRSHMKSVGNAEGIHIKSTKKPFENVIDLHGLHQS